MLPLRPGGPNQDQNNLKNFLGNSLWREKNVLQGRLTGDTRDAVESLAYEVLRLHEIIEQMSQRLAQLEKKA